MKTEPVEYVPVLALMALSLAAALSTHTGVQLVARLLGAS